MRAMIATTTAMIVATNTTRWITKCSRNHAATSRISPAMTVWPNDLDDFADSFIGLQPTSTTGVLLAMVSGMRYFGSAWGERPRVWLAMGLTFAGVVNQLEALEAREQL